MRILVEDVTELDAPAVVVGEQVVPGVRLPLSAPVDFAVAVDLDARRSYSVRVHADTSGDGRVSSGDFVSVQSYPVDADHTGPLAVEVRAVVG